VMRILMHLGLAVHGHESVDSLHCRNFIELFSLLRNSDEFLDNDIISRSGNAHYMTPE